MQRACARALARALALASVCGAARADGPGLGNFAYAPEELFKPIGVITSPLGHGRPAMVDGYLMVVYSSDGGGLPGDGGLEFWDVSDPRRPRLAFRHDNAETHRLREAHGFSFAKLPGDRIAWAAQSETGIQIWDLSEADAPALLGELALPGVMLRDYGGVWWLTWQAPYLYVAGVESGLFVVDTSDPTTPQLLRHMPSGQLSGINPTVVHALGDLLIVSEPLRGRVASFDISEPASPVLLHTAVIAPGYSYAVAAGKLVASGGAPSEMVVYDLDHDGGFSFAGRALSTLGNGAYGSHQDGHFISGFSTGVAEFSLEPPALIGVGTSGFEHRDEDFGEVMGNLILSCDDHGVGSAFIVRQTSPDATPPYVAWSNPPAGASGVGLRSPIHLSMSDQIEASSLGPATLRIVAPNGVTVSGTYSVTQGLVSFSPAVPFSPRTRYQIELEGLRDWSGNAALPFRSDFQTADVPTSAGPGCAIAPLAPVPVGALTRFAHATLVAGSFSSWDFGDGSPPTPVSSAAERTHAYARPGRYPVLLTVSDDDDLERCAAVQIVYAPPSPVAPVSSSSIVVDAGRAYVVNQDHDSASAIDVATSALAWEAPVGKEPVSLALAPDHDLWIVNRGSATISVLDATGAEMDEYALPAGSRPYGLVFDPTGRAYVTLEALGEVAVLTAEGDVTRRVAVGPRPRGIAIDGSGRKALVTRFVSAAARGELYELDLESFSSRVIALAFDAGPDTEASGRGVPNYLAQVVISPDGASAVVPSKKDNVARGRYRDGLDLTFESRVRAIVSRISPLTGTEELGARLDFNDRDMPQSAVFSPLGDLLFVAMQGSDTVEVVDRTSGAPVSVLATGQAPRGLAITPGGDRLLVHDYLSRSLSIFDTSELVAGRSNAIPQLAGVPSVGREVLPLEVLQGKRIFYRAADPRMSRDGYLSCASCHLDGEDDGQVWDLTQLGEGLRNTISLQGRAGLRHGNLHWTANFDEIQDFEHDIRSMFGGRGFMSDAAFAATSSALGLPKVGLSPELDALAAYVSSLDQFPRSPFRQPSGRLSLAAQRGRALFELARCAECHAGADFTDESRHDIGTIGPGSGSGAGAALVGVGFETPTLRGAWSTPPYLHDGSAATLEEAISRHQRVARPTRPSDVADLAAYVRQIDGLEPPPRRVPSRGMLSSFVDWFMSLWP